MTLDEWLEHYPESPLGVLVGLLGQLREGERDFQSFEHGAQAHVVGQPTVDQVHVLPARRRGLLRLACGRLQRYALRHSGHSQPGRPGPRTGCLAPVVLAAAKDDEGAIPALDVDVEIGGADRCSVLEIARARGQLRLPERIARIMDRLGLKEGEVISHSMVTSSIERAQKKVEENNFGIRKRLLEYDNVMNSQREVIYKRRRNALFGERLQLDILNMLYDTCDDLSANAKAGENAENFRVSLLSILGLDFAITQEKNPYQNTKLLLDGLDASGVAVPRLRRAGDGTCDGVAGHDPG